VSGRPLAAAVALLLALALVGQTVRGFSRVRSTLLLGAVRRHLVAAQATGRLPGVLLRAADAAIEEAARLHPPAIEPRAFRGDLMLATDRLADAVRAYDAALAHEVRAETLMHQGIALWQLGREEEALVQMRRAVALAKNLADVVPPAARGRLEATPLVPLPPAGGAAVTLPAR
jgi:tetratricopeptide (TPR) repeat protein